jgi:NAD(P)-dependent dehydrogenase (short-subunit alcohol dehydrogenase family)
MLSALMVKDNGVQEFAGKVAVVTGAASGVGRAFAERFAREGMRVVLADVEQTALDRAVGDLRHQDYDVVGVRTDVAHLASVQNLARRALAAYGKIHVVCNNAGPDSYRDAPLWEAPDKDWLWAFGVNFWGVVHGARTFMPIMLGQDEEGHMVNTASLTGLVRSGDVDGITKHAVVALTETMYSQLAQRETKLAVSVLCPGAVHTRRQMIKRMAVPMPPAQIADIVLQAIKDRQLYVLTDLHQATY